MCYCVLFQVHWSLLQKRQILQIRLCELVAAGGGPGVEGWGGLVVQEVVVLLRCIGLENL